MQTKHTDQEQTEYAQGHDMGYKAFMDGNFRNQNPFDAMFEPDLAQGWIEGWMDAKEENK